MAEPRRALGEGAAQEAPTAPHATPHPAGQARSGPERFWSRWPVRVALGACLIISGVAHCAVVPIEIPHGFEMNDVEGEAAIPVDVLDTDDTPPSPPPPPPPAEVRPSDQQRAKELAAAAARRPDAGTARDAGSDASEDAAMDAPSDAPPDGAPDGGGLDGAIASTEAGAGASGPKDPEAIIGAGGSIQADVVLVMVVVNAEVIRTNPIGAKMGFLLRGIPQWDEFMSGTDLDPVRDTDWVMISGPSLVNTTRDVVLVHYSASDAAVDKAVEVVSHKYDRGGHYDAGVPGVRASLAHADKAERVILRPQPRVLAVVPTSVAQKVARQLASAKVPTHIRPGEALYIRLVNPNHPMPEIPATITELRLRVVPRADQGADLFIDGDTKDAETASKAAEDVKEIVKRHDDWVTSSLTHGLLDHVDVRAEGSQVRAHLTASRDQIETLLTLVSEFMGVRAGGPIVPPATPPTGSK